MLGEPFRSWPEMAKSLQALNLPQPGHGQELWPESIQSLECTEPARGQKQAAGLAACSGLII